MGHQFMAECSSCHNSFRVCEGGGFFFHLIHCNECGQEKSIEFDNLGEIHLRYLKGLPGPYAIVSSDSDKDVRQNYKGQPLSEDEYHKAVELFAGTCACGGSFKFDAKSRCPKCNSTEYIDTGQGVMYD